MKKSVRIFSALLTLIIMLSLFTGCDFGKKLFGKDLLIGDWKTEFEHDNMKLAIQFTFKEDGSGECTFPQESYDYFIDQMVTRTKEELGIEELAEEGIENDEKLKTLLMEDYPYEELANSFYSTFTWTLNGDALTINADEGSTMTAATKLSEGVSTFIAIGDDQTEREFTKVN